MEKQQLFKEKYLLTLKEKIDTGKYRTNEFVYDKKQTLMMPNIQKPDGLLNKLNFRSDFESAILIFEAFKNLEPIQASDERLWTYLSHVDLYPYMIKRWDGVHKGSTKDTAEYIREHWFLKSTAQGSLLRHAISGLWWSVYISIDETRNNDKYELTEILFRNQTMRTRTLGTYNLARHKEAMIGLLEFIKENWKHFSHFEKEHQRLTEHLNLLGGVKPIAYYKRDFFKTALEKYYNTLNHSI